VIAASQGRSLESYSLTEPKGSFAAPVLFFQSHVKPEANQRSVQSRDQVWCCIIFLGYLFPEFYIQISKNDIANVTEVFF